MVFHPVSGLADSIEDGFCMTNANQYDVISSARPVMTPNAMYMEYLENYISKQLDREAQEVLRRMTQGDQPLEAALEAHIGRYHGNKSAEEVAKIRQTVTGWLGAAEEIRQMIAIYEAPIRLEQVEAKLDDLWAARRETHTQMPVIDAYQAQLAATYDTYLSRGDDPQSAAVKAYVETFNALELDLGTAGVSELEPGSSCYKDALFRHEAGMRMDRVNASEIGQYDPEFLERVNTPPKMPKFQYYTHGYMRADYTTVRGDLAARLER